MISETFWNYFLVLESDFYKTTRFVELNELNYKTFSLEYTKLLLSVCSEIDVICKELCIHIDPSKKRKNINDYRAIIKNKFPKFETTKVTIEKFGIEIIPWKEFNENKNPNWWKSYNDVKHDRIINYIEANQQNVIHSISGLLVLLLYLYKFVNNDECKSGTKLFDSPGMGSSIIFAADIKLPDFE